MQLPAYPRGGWGPRTAAFQKKNARDAEWSCTAINKRVWLCLRTKLPVRSENQPTAESGSRHYVLPLQVVPTSGATFSLQYPETAITHALIPPAATPAPCSFTSDDFAASRSGRRRQALCLFLTAPPLAEAGDPR